jgi:hypothetical protein
MAENKTKPTGASVRDYIASRATAQQASDCRELIRLLRSITGKPAKMWGPSIVGFDSYRYAYESGRTGEMCIAGFAIRGRDLVLYLMFTKGNKQQQALLSKLGKHKLSGSCLHFKQLADLDTAVLEQLVSNSIAEARRRYA